MSVWPNGKSTPPTVTSPFGYSAGYEGMHWGLDTIGHYYNHAIDSGVVIHVGWNSFGDSRGGGGWEVWYRLDNGDVIVTYHNRRGLLVAKGDRVVAGTRLGIQSNSGFAFGIHCHTEVWRNGRRDQRTDPYAYIAALVGSTPAGGGTTPIEEEEEMSAFKARQIHWTNKADGRTFRALYVEGTGYWVEWTEGGAKYANAILKQHETGDSMAVTESLAGAFRSAAQRLQTTPTEQ